MVYSSVSTSLLAYAPLSQGQALQISSTSVAIAYFLSHQLLLVSGIDC